MSNNQGFPFLSYLGSKIRTLLPQKSSLAARTARASLWSIVGIGLTNVLRLVNNLVMTHILLPEAFGLMAMVTTIQVGLSLFTDIGIQQSVVRAHNGHDPKFLRVAWTIQTLRGTAIAGLVVAAAILLWLLAPLFADATTVYADPLLPWLIAVSSLNMILAGLESTNQWLAFRDMLMGRLTVANIAAQIVAMAAMIAFAQIDASVWALLAGMLVGAAFRTAMSHIIFPGPRMAVMWDRNIADDLWKFGRWIIGSSMLGFIANQADRLILGALLGAEAFGYYVIAFAWVQVFNLVIDKLTADVGYSAFSEVLRETPERVSQVYRKLSLSVDAACIAGFVLCLVVGPWLIHTLYKPSYATAATFMPILAMSILPRRFDTITSLILSSGKSSTIMYISALRAITICVALVAGYHFLGMTGALLAVGLSQLAGVPLAIKTASPILGGRVWRDVAWIVVTVGIAVMFALFGQVTVAGS